MSARDWTGRSAALSEGLAAAGLVVATPTFVGYSYLSSRINTLLHDMERAGIEVVHMLTDHAPSAAIISFQQAQEKNAERRVER